jgi:hypothetical protein
MDPALQLIMYQLNNMESKMSAGQEEIKKNISCIEDKISSDVSANRSGQEEFEEKMTDKLDKRLKGVVTLVEQQSQELREEFNNESQETWRDLGVARGEIERTQRYLRLIAAWLKLDATRRES